MLQTHGTSKAFPWSANGCRQCVQKMSATASSSGMIAAWGYGPSETSYWAASLSLPSAVCDKPTACSFLPHINVLRFQATVAASPSDHTAHLVPTLLCVCHPCQVSRKGGTSHGASSVRKQRGVNASVEVHFILFILLSPTVQGSQSRCPCSVKPFWRHPHRHTQKTCFHGDSRSHRLE